MSDTKFELLVSSIEFLIYRVLYNNEAFLFGENSNDRTYLETLSLNHIKPPKSEKNESYSSSPSTTKSDSSNNQIEEHIAVIQKKPNPSSESSVPKTNGLTKKSDSTSIEEHKKPLFDIQNKPFQTSKSFASQGTGLPVKKTNSVFPTNFNSKKTIEKPSPKLYEVPLPNLDSLHSEPKPLKSFSSPRSSANQVLEARIPYNLTRVKTRGIWKLLGTQSFEKIHLISVLRSLLAVNEFGENPYGNN